jgi:KDO2-lipid IV(A) lauroyltransferase
MATLRERIIWRIQYTALRLVEMGMQCFPIDTNLKSARLGGYLLYRFDKKHRERAMENLRAAFPGEPEAKLQRIARKSCEHLMMVAAETLCMPRLMQFNRMLDVVDISQIIEAFQYTASGKPCLLITGHFGNWEMAGFTMATMGFPPVAIARPLDNPLVNAHIMGLRQKRGLKILYKKGMTDEAVDALKSGRILGFIADQDAGRRGFFVDFFGRKASAYKSIAYLAMEMNVRIYVGGAYRTGKNFHYRIVQGDVIDPADFPQTVDGAYAITQRITTGIEKTVRMAPEQYLWVHRRWKTRPPEERKAAAAAKEEADAEEGDDLAS